jgi:hypothetical protein
MWREGGRGLGTILERNGKADSVGGIGEGEGSEEVKVVAEATGMGSTNRCV